MIISFFAKNFIYLHMSFKFNSKKGDTTMKKVMTRQTEKDPLNPMTWDASQWKDAIIGGILSVFIFGTSLLIITVFG